MPDTHINRLKCGITSVAGSGTGTITLGSAESGFRTFASGDDGKTFSCLFLEGTNWEVATGCLYTHSGTTLTRGTLEASSSGSAITLTSAGKVSVIAPASLGNRVEEAVESIGVACSDETTALTTGTAKVTFRMPYAFTLTSVRASVNTAPTGANLVVDINDGGVSILSTKLSIDGGEKTSATAATPAVISTAALASDDENTIDIDQIGSTVAGAGLKVWLIGRRA